MTRIAIVGGDAIDIDIQRIINLMSDLDTVECGLIVLDSLGIVTDEHIGATEENDMRLGLSAWPIHGHHRQEIRSYERAFELDEDLKKDEFMAKIRGDHSCKRNRRSRGQIRKR